MAGAVVPAIKTSIETQPANTNTTHLESVINSVVAGLNAAGTWTPAPTATP
jgi:hypothetical protein